MLYRREEGTPPVEDHRYPDEPPWRPGLSVAARRGSAGMSGRHTVSIRLLPLGAGHRLLGAALVIAILWGAFFWATTTPGW